LTPLLTSYNRLAFHKKAGRSSFIHRVGASPQALFSTFSVDADAGIARNLARIEGPHSQVRMISVDDQRLPSAGRRRRPRSGVMWAGGTRQANGSRFASPAARRAPVAHLLAGQMSADYHQAVPKIDLPEDELAAVTAAIRAVIAGDRYPHAPRLDPLRAALARLEVISSGNSFSSAPLPKAAPPAKADKRARR
jgi:hypothetical protein